MAVDPRKQSEINDLVREYLLSTDYLETVHAFDRETHRNNISEEQTTNEDRNAERLSEIQESCLLAFNEGDRETFFALWDEHFPPSVRLSDSVYSKLEFTLSIYLLCFQSTVTSIREWQRSGILRKLWIRLRRSWRHEGGSLQDHAVPAVLRSSLCA
ncbi:hypothetical protein BJ742DRAFT_783914 [Cladochytrium replicatum]|nr:hypothetical protein BJ742DRAFT_783914 [Cladochytrium replicatum]